MYVLTRHLCNVSANVRHQKLKKVTQSVSAEPTVRFSDLGAIKIHLTSQLYEAQQSF